MKIRNTLAAAVLAALLPCQPALAEVRGVAYEVVNPKAPRSEWQRKPLAGVYVVMNWWITVPGPGHATDACLHSEIARSNDKGEYVIEGPNLLTAGVARGSILAYAPGMDRAGLPVGRPDLHLVSLARSAASPDDRLNMMIIYDLAGCHSREMHDPQKVLQAYREALAAEAKALEPVTHAGRNMRQGLLARAGHPPKPAEPRIVPQGDAPRPAASTPR